MISKKHSYFKDDIRKMLLLYSIIPVILLTIIFLVVLGGIWYFTTVNTNNRENNNIALTLEGTITSYIEVIENLEQKDIIFDHEVTAATRVEIFEILYETSNQLGRNADLYIVDQDIDVILTGTPAIPSFISEGHGENWGIFRAMTQSPNNIAYKIIKDDQSDNMQLAIGKAKITDGLIKGYIIILLDSIQFQTDLVNMASQTVITDGYGWVFTANNFNFLDRLHHRINLTLDRMNGRIQNDKENYYIFSTPILEDQFYIYSISPLNIQITMIKSNFIVVSFAFVMMIITVTISARRMAAKKTKDLYTVIEAFKKLEHGDMDTTLDISSNDEFEVIANSYNLMLVSLKNHIESNKEMGKLVAYSQSKQLESQFNPHFLFNTLENIRFMCKLDPPSASTMVLNLSTLLRYSISNNKEEVTVQEDVVYTENYLSILKYRFNRRFHYNIEIPTEIESCIIPKLILQPMIENSIKYGFEGKDHLLVEINAHIENDTLILTCLDDGAGMKPEILEEIKKLMTGSMNKSSHSGLYNIHRRVQLKYGEAYGIHIESKLGVGTILNVVLPIRYDTVGGK